jgi:hypothetical protein
VLIGTPRDGQVELEDAIVRELLRRCEAAGLEQTVKALNEAAAGFPAEIPTDEAEGVLEVVDKWITTELGPAKTPQGLSELRAALAV